MTENGGELVFMFRGEIAEFQFYQNRKAEKLIMMPFCQEDLEMHGHNFFELAYITGGTAEHTLENEGKTHVQQVGIVRFNAFDNTGSDLSFAVAMLNAANTGFVLSGIYGREESRVYAKPLIKGESTYTLTKEEKQAIEHALKK